MASCSCIAHFSLSFSAVTIFDLSSSQNLVEVCMQQTGGLGVNIIIDDGGMRTVLHTHTSCHNCWEFSQRRVSYEFFGGGWEK